MAPSGGWQPAAGRTKVDCMWAEQLLLFVEGRLQVKGDGDGCRMGGRGLGFALGMTSRALDPATALFFSTALLPYEAVLLSSFRTLWEA